MRLARVKALVKKELIQLRRDKTTFGMVVAIPIIWLLMFGYAINMDPKNLPMALNCRDNSPLSRSIVSGLENSGYFRIVAEISDDKTGEKLLKQGKVLFVLNIGENFTKGIIRAENPKILLQADASDPVAVSSAISAISGVSQSVINKEFKGNLAHLRTKNPPFEILLHRNFNPEGFTRYNIIPGLIGMVLIFTGVMMTALSLTRERELGTMENLLSMPVTPLEVMIGKITPFVFIGIVQTSLIIIMAKFLFEVPILGSLALLFFCSFIFIVCNLALGFLISTIAKNQTQALQMSVFVMLPSMLLSGFMFPFLGMPSWAQFLGQCFPLTYFLRICRAIMLKNAQFADILPNLALLCLIVLVITALTLKAYKNTLD